MAKRPVFWPELGQFFKEFRTAKGWSQRQAVQFAKSRAASITRQRLLRLESGATKNPEPDDLRAVAALYGIPYEELVAKWVRHRYQADVSGRDSAPTSTRILDLEQRLSANAATALRVRNAATELARVMTGDDEVEELLDLWMHFDEDYRTGVLKMMRAWREGAPTPGDASVGTRAVPRRQSGVRGKRET